MMLSYGCHQNGRGLSWKTGVQQLGFEELPERCDRGAISYLERE